MLLGMLQHRPCYFPVFTFSMFPFGTHLSRQGLTLGMPWWLRRCRSYWKITAIELATYRKPRPPLFLLLSLLRISATFLTCCAPMVCLHTPYRWPQQTRLWSPWALCRFVLHLPRFHTCRPRLRRKWQSFETVVVFYVVGFLNPIQRCSVTFLLVLRRNRPSYDRASDRLL